MTIVYLNGKFIPQEEAMISVMDRGFLFGDGVYEVIPVYGNKQFRFEQHILRLNRSLSSIHLNLDMDLVKWEEVLTTLLEHNALHGKNQSIYLQVTRGSAKERNHAFPKFAQATVFALSSPLRTLPLEQLSEGMSAILLRDIRWECCHIKSTSLLANVLLYQQALDKSAAEAILIRNGYAVEGATSNLFIVKEGIIKTPPLSHHILGGITRDLVLELAKEHKLENREENITEQELLKADEVWITSSTREIYPIVKIDEKPVGKGKPGSIWHKMIKNYHNFIKKIG